MPASGRYVVLSGKYRIRNQGGGLQPRPDGDTIKFEVDTPDVVRQLPRFNNVAPHISGSGAINLRLEVIDALETHFPSDGGRGPEVHQSMTLALEARDNLVTMLGFTHVVFNEDSTVKSADSFTVDGHILANGVEGNGRVVGFAYAGRDLPKPNGERLRLGKPLMDKSANIKLLNKGLAYATLYQTMPIELILHARDLTHKARAKKIGVFGSEDVGVSKSTTVANLAALQKLVLLPKLFRRLADFFVITGDSLRDFDAWVREDPKRDDRMILPSSEVGNLHDLYEVVGGKRLKLQFNPEDMQVLE